MKRLTICVAALAVAAVGQAFAHHSGAMFDKDKTVVISGTVKEFQYTNPHSWLQVLVADKSGKQVEWSFETEGPSALLRSGIKQSTFSPGDQVQVSTHPIKDGRPAGSLISVTKADGSVWGLGVSKPAGQTASP